LNGSESEDLVSIGVGLVETAAAAGVTARLLGGIAVAVRCSSVRSPGPLARPYADLDFATTRSSVKGLRRVFTNSRLSPAERFNAISGHSRLLYYTERGTKVDVFIEDFQQCHVLHFANRLKIHPITIPLADLLLTKLQVAQLSGKDVIDMVAMMLDHELADDESGINVRYVARLLAKDWGWWRSATETLDRVIAELPHVQLDPTRASVVHARLRYLRGAIDAEPKTLHWRARSRLGDRWSWRVEPEENRA
jgi:hypothetical protein